MKSVIPLLCSLVIGALPRAALADEHPASIAAGEAASVACQACHGSNGMNASPDIPDLAAQKRIYLAMQLRAFRSGDRKNDVMTPIAAQLADSDIANLATYWNSVPVSATGASSVQLEASRSPLTFPANFPHGFVLYQTSPTDADGSFNRGYANDVAAAAARASKPLPNGSVIVVAAYARNSTTPTYSMMESRAGWGDNVPALLRNGDWRYALFDAKQQRRDPFNYAKCLACHKPAADKSFVFTLDALAKSAPDSASRGE